MPEPIVFSSPIVVLDSEGSAVLDPQKAKKLTKQLEAFRAQIADDSKLPEGNEVSAFLEDRRDKRLAPGPETAADCVEAVKRCWERAQQKSRRHFDLVGMAALCVPAPHDGTPPRVTTKAIGLSVEWTRNAIALTAIQECVVKGADAAQFQFQHPLKVVRGILGATVRSQIGAFVLSDGRSIAASQALAASGATAGIDARDAATLRLLGELEMHTRDWPPPSPPQRMSLSEEEVLGLLKLAEDLENQAYQLRASLQAALGKQPWDDIHDPPVYISD